MPQIHRKEMESRMSEWPPKLPEGTSNYLAASGYTYNRDYNDFCYECGAIINGGELHVRHKTTMHHYHYKCWQEKYED